MLNGPLLFPFTIVPLHGGSGHLSSTTWTCTALSFLNCISIGSAVFAQLTAERRYTLRLAAPSHTQLPLRMGDLDLI